MDVGALKEIIRVFEASGLSELEIEEDGRRICLRKPGSDAAVGTGSGSRAEVTASGSDTTVNDSCHLISAPMAGVFYGAPSPDDPPFVAPGDAVDAGQVVGIVEAMKLKNEVVATFAAVIEEMLVEDGQPVEFGQALFVMRPI